MAPGRFFRSASNSPQLEPVAHYGFPTIHPQWSGRAAVRIRGLDLTPGCSRQTDIRSARASLVSGIKRIVHARVRDALTQKSPETKYLLVQDEQDSGPFYKPLVAVLVAVLNSSHLFFRKFYEPLVGQETLAGRCEPFNIERYGSAVAIP
jgi:hypothetical protein